MPGVQCSTKSGVFPGVTENDTTTKDHRPGEDVSRVGLFGGTFDPVHRGHLRVILDVKEAFGLDRVIVIPSAVPPHKTLKHVSNADDRLAMTKLCFDKKEGFVVSDVELKRRGPSYTIDTIDHVMALKAPHECLMLIMGTDAFFEIHTWKAYRDILARTHLVVMKRPGLEGDMVEKAGQYLRDVIDGGYRFIVSDGCFRHGLFRPVHLFAVSPMDESSTEIRRCIKNNLDVSSFLLPEVEAYIRDKGLYR